MKIFLGTDHGGFELKEAIKAYLIEAGLDVEDLGNTEMDPEDDYVDFAKAVAEEVAKNEDDRGLLFCRSAAGMVMAANKVDNIRAVAAFDEKSAKHSREHNNANVLALSGDWLDADKAQKMVDSWLKEPFSHEERHRRRVHKISELEHAGTRD